MLKACVPVWTVLCVIPCWAGQAHAAQPKRPALPARYAHIRTFGNFTNQSKKAAEVFDLIWDGAPSLKAHNPNLLVLKYALVTTCMVPSDKAKALAAYCVRRGLTRQGVLEGMFLHFGEDTKRSFPVRGGWAKKQTRTVPGWDARNDPNGDGRVDDAEFASRVNPKASARTLQQARVPVYYWGPPTADFAMNVGHPEYQRFMATVHIPRIVAQHDGIAIDSCKSSLYGVAGGEQCVEYPDHAKWFPDICEILGRIKQGVPGKLVIGNNWRAEPFVLDGAEDEGWLSLKSGGASAAAALRAAVDADRHARIQLLQYRMSYDPRWSPLGAGTPSPVTPEREQIYALALYYLCHGRYTYFGYGGATYTKVQDIMPAAHRFDVGQPTGPFRDWVKSGAERSTGRNLLVNGGFEQEFNGWTPAKPIEIDRAVKHEGACSARMTSASMSMNNITIQRLKLAPNAAYTLSFWMRTHDVHGAGAQVYLYEFDSPGYAGPGWTTVSGTTDWTRYDMPFRTGAKAAGRVSFRLLNARGTAWLDGFTLVEGVPASAARVFCREFDKALVLVKPHYGLGYGDRTAKTYALPGSFRPLRADGALGEPVREIVLRGGEAAILARQR